jgi:hypothetical protein
MTLRATRSHYWGVTEVEEACRSQLDALPAYRSAVAIVAARLATAYDMSEAARQINKCYAAFFVPFWWEHILLRGVLEPLEHKRIVDGSRPPRRPRLRLRPRRSRPLRPRSTRLLPPTLAGPLRSSRYRTTGSLHTRTACNPTVTRCRHLLRLPSPCTPRLLTTCPPRRLRLRAYWQGPFGPHHRY